MKAFLTALSLTLGLGIAQAQNPAPTDDDHRLALAAFQQKDYTQAARLFERLVERDPSRGLFWFNLGNSYFMLADYPRAESAYRKVVLLKSPLSIPARIYLAKTFRNQGRLNEAREIVRTLPVESLSETLRGEVDAERDSLKASFCVRAFAAYHEGDFSQALSLLAASLDVGFSIEAAMLRGLTLLRLGRPSEAEEAFRNTIGAPSRSDADAKLQRDARDFLGEIEEGKWPKEIPFWLFTELAAGYNSNLFGNSDSDGPTARGVR